MSIPAMACASKHFKSGLSMFRGHSSEESLKSAACTVINYAIDILHIHPNNIVLYYHKLSVTCRYGYSLGSAISVFLSTYILKSRECKVAGLILHVNKECLIIICLELFYVYLPNSLRYS